MAREIETYLHARKNFEKIAGEIDDLAFSIVEVGELLRDDPSDIAFGNTGITIASTVSRIIDASDWKSGREIQEMLADYRDAKNAMEASWESVPPEFREAILPLFESQD
jgi:hypothetical protein